MLKLGAMSSYLLSFHNTKTFFRIINWEFQTNWCSCILVRIETVSCRLLLAMAKMDMDWN